MAGQRRDELFLGGERSSTSVAPLRLNKNEGLQISNTGDYNNLPASIVIASPHQEPPLPRMRRRSVAQEQVQLPYPDRPAAEREHYYAAQQQEQSPEESSSHTPPANSTPPSLAIGRGARKNSIDSFPAPPAFRARQPKRTSSMPVTETSEPEPEAPRPPLSVANENPYPSYHQQYWPPQSTLDRSSSIASNITVTARRGSPAPPETPIVPPGSLGDRFNRAYGLPSTTISSAPNRTPSVASSNSIPITLDLSGSATPSQFGGSNIRASQVFGSQYHYDEGERTPTEGTHDQRPWTPTESPGSYNHGPPTIWQGAGRQPGQRPESDGQQPVQPPVGANGQPQFIPAPTQESYGAPSDRLSQATTISPYTQQRPGQQGSPAMPQQRSRIDPSQLEQDFQRLNVDEPPPSYETAQHANPSKSGTEYPEEKADAVSLSANRVQSPPIQNSQQPQLQQQQHPQIQPLQLQQSNYQSSYTQSQPPQNMQNGYDHQGYQQQPQQQPQHQIQQQQQQQQQPMYQDPYAQQQAQQDPYTQQQQMKDPYAQYNQQHDQKPQQATQDNITTQYVTLPGGGGVDAGPMSPPPLPDGWMSHLDPSSGQYYYIHIPTQRTQWEFPAPETGMSFTSGALSPGFGPLSPGIMSPGMFSEALLSPAQSTFGTQMTLPPTPGMPPIQPPIQIPGISSYKVAPSNGAYFGPYLRYTNMDLEHGIWLGSILLVTAVDPPSVHIHQSLDLSPNPRQLEGHPIFAHKNWTFYRYDIDIPMGDIPAKWTYAVTSHLGCTRYEYLVAARTDRNWRFIAHSCNDFSPNVNPNERTRLGGVPYMWKDVMQKHIEVGGFHCQIGAGDQIYADKMWKEVPLLKDWLLLKGKENRKNAVWTPRHEEDVQHAYFHFYTSHFDQPHIREAWAQIPHICQINAHDIFDGFGSYPEHMQFSNMFKNIGRIAVDWYLLFQHHTTLNILRAVPDDRDLFSITGTGWHFIKYLGPGVAVVGPDTRSERNPHQVMAGPTYQGLFPRIATLPTSVQHVIMILAVPIIYPRLDMAESVAHTMQQSKKAVNGLFNMTGKIAGGVAGVVGAKGLVGEGFNSVKKAVGKTGLMSNVVSIFGEVDLLDDLRDYWTHQSKDLERTYLIRTLQSIAHARGIRFTFLSGDVQCCGAGLVHDPSKPADHKTMYQIITSSIVNTPPSNMVMKMLHNNRTLYIPQNGMRSTNIPSDTKEDMIELFANDVNGQPRAEKKLLPRRNYAIFAAYETQAVVDYSMPVVAEKQGTNPLSLAVDFIVQGDGIYSTTSKYGPVVIPRCEFGY